MLDFDFIVEALSWTLEALVSLREVERTVAWVIKLLDVFYGRVVGVVGRVADRGPTPRLVVL